ncbi:MAG TPA: DUF4389 domain-containing protein [Dehalococcoidia bacterium]|nr:DUF4389 domain-containing protein [Dehalococcoidia bacterium]
MAETQMQQPVAPTSPSGGYPVSFTVDYPDGPRNRLTTFFRLFTVIPIYIVLILLTGGSFNGDSSIFNWGSGFADRDTGWSFAYATWGILFAATLLMVLFRQKYPRWWFDWNLALTRFSARFESYLFLLRDEYPSTDEEQAVHLEIVYPDVKKDLNRWLPLVKWFLAIPHYIVLVFLGIAAIVATIFAWFAILFTGRYPRSLFDMVVGTYRWALRVAAYALLLTTDRYPPFSLS